MSIAEKVLRLKQDFDEVYRAGAVAPPQDVKTQEKTVKPSTEIQEVLPDNGYALSKVTVEAVDKHFIDTSKITNFNHFFRSNARLELLDKVDFSQMYTCAYIFVDCTNLTEEPLFVTHENAVETATCTFQGCKNLKSIKKNNYIKFGNISGFCERCTSLEEVDSNFHGYNHNGIFNGCTALKKVAVLDLERSLNNSSMFNNCTNLTDLTLTNIKLNIQIGSGNTWGHLLTVDSLINTIKELVNVGATRTLTMGSVNKAKIADIYCIVTDNTTTKMSIEIVEAGTEGAMTLENFASLKGWAIT